MRTPTLQDRLGWLRFSFHRSYARANRAQARRLVGDLIARPRVRTAGIVSIGLTHRCQKRCAWCATAAYRRDGAGEMTTAEVERLLHEVAASRHRFRYVSFLGGEPLLRRDLAHLVRTATGLGLFLHLDTNGLLLDAPRVRALLRAGLNSAFVAWELGPAMDERTRRQRERVAAGVAECVRQGLPCFLSACACPGDVRGGHVARALEEGRALGAAGVRLFAVRPSGTWLHRAPEGLLGAAEVDELRRLCRSGYAFLTDDAERAAGRSCAAQGRRMAYVSPYGELQPCHFFPYGFASVRGGGLDAALGRMWSHPMLGARCDDCPLCDPAFRARHIAPLAAGASLPIVLS